jgi:hypothetical protein
MLETVKENDFILSRKNAPLAKICIRLIKKGVRAKIKGRDIGQGLLSRLKSLDIEDLSALPNALFAWEHQEARKYATLDADLAAEKLELVRDQVDLFLCLSEGLTYISELEGRISSFFVDDAEKGNVCLSSVHKAKGLEAERVFLLQETFVRKSKEGKIVSNQEEENIRYVAITRAKSDMFWVKE